jgi:hypothetical protein
MKVTFCNSGFENAWSLDVDIMIPQGDGTTWIVPMYEEGFMATDSTIMVVDS